MVKIKIAVQGNRAALLGSIDLVAGTVGQQCNFYFGDDWKNLKKKITYKVGSTVLGTENITSNEATIPAYVLATAGLPLEIGITGYSADKSIITPTTWCLLGVIKNGATIYSNANDDNSGEDDTNKHIIYDGGVIV